jgi:hypothetical protein
MPGSIRIERIVLARFEVIDIIGVGGEGEVLKAIDTITGAIVAIKQLCACPSDPSYEYQVARMKRAGQIRVGHPCVLDSIGCGEEDGKWYLVMPFVDGVDLEIFVRACGGRCPVDRAIPIICALADGLGAVHNCGTVHRDIKPLNIIITPDEHPTIIDFGICRNVHEKTIGNGQVIGTPAYMSPEQAEGKKPVDHRSDIFSLGLVTYYMIVGQPAVQASDPEDAKRIIRQAELPALRQLDPTVPVHVDAACTRMLAKRPEDRFQSAAELYQALTKSPPQEGTLFCPSCGKPAQAGARFSTCCGVNLHGPKAVVLCLACGGKADNVTACPACQRSFSSANHRFVFDAGSVTGKTFRIPEGTFVVGRDIIESRDFSISRRHFRVECNNGTVRVQDAGSTNKTYVAGQLADRLIQLRPNQEFLIAGNRAVYLSR